MSKLLTSFAGIVLVASIAIGADTRVSVEGIIVQLNEPGTINVEISIGSDDGVNMGDTFVVMRDNDRLGQLKIFEVTPDRASAKISRLKDAKSLRKGDFVRSQHDRRRE